MSNTSLLSTVLVTGLTTALAVGAYQHFSTVNTMKDSITAMEDTIARLNVEALKATQGSFLAPSLTATASAATKPGGAPAGNSDGSGDWVYGNPKARFTLFELTDTECPYCKDHFPLIQTLTEASGGNMNAALIHIPVQGEASRRQAVAVECAGEQGGSEAAWRMMGMILERTRGNGKGMPEPTPVLASQLSLDQQRFIACTESVEVTDRIGSDLNAAMKMGIAQTPSTLVHDNETGKSILLQGSYANSDGIINAIEKLTLNTVGETQ